MVGALCFDGDTQRCFFFWRKKPNASIVFEAVLYEPCRVVLHLPISNCQSVGERKQRPITIGCRWSPILLLESSFDVLSRYRISGIFAEPTEQIFHPAGIIPVTKLISL